LDNLFKSSKNLGFQVIPRKISHLIQVKPIVAKQSKEQNVGMPSRHIPNHAFDDILSELGDDPAIPDPHGIRKAKPLQNNSPEQTIKHSMRQKSEVPSDPLNITPQLKKLGGLLAISVCLLALGIALFAAYESIKPNSQAAMEDSQKHFSELKKEIVLLRNEMQSHQEDLYKELDLIEVSIHSLKENKTAKKQIYKPQAIPHESELSRWRYLGNSQMGDSHRAFFNTGKDVSTFEKGVMVLGDWRLNNVAKDAATLTHPQGKSLILKSSKSD
jgi:hypothetical protein